MRPATLDVGSCGGVGGAVDHKRELNEQGEWGGGTGEHRAYGARV